MNLFFLDLIPAICALYHCDKHVVKMILENAEILSCVHWLTGGTEAPYKLMKGHKRFPAIAWLMESIHNYRWTVEMGLALCAEYTHRYGKVHAVQSKIEWLKANEPKGIPDVPMTILTPAVPDECIRYDANGVKDPIASYKAYYVFVKRYFAKWTKRSPPDWFTKGVDGMDDKEREASDKKILEVKGKYKKRSTKKRENTEKKKKQEEDGQVEVKKEKAKEKDKDKEKEKEKKGKRKSSETKLDPLPTTKEEKEKKGKSKSKKAKLDPTPAKAVTSVYFDKKTKAKNVK